MVQCPKCEIAWRVLDAQYWGVPQRRKRIFLVADFATADRRAAEVLFVEPCVPRDSAESERAREEIAGGTGKSIDSANGIAYSFDSKASNSMKSANPHSGCRQVEIAKCLDTTVPEPSKNQGGIAIVCKPKEVEYAITAKHYKNRNAALRDRERINAMREKTVGALLRRDYKGIGNQDLPKCDKLIIEKKYTVRRLTPLEAERLQGLPDGYTDVPLNGKPASDANRYKALGNGMAQPCADYVIQRIVDEVGKT